MQPLVYKHLLIRMGYCTRGRVVSAFGFWAGPGFESWRCQEIFIFSTERHPPLYMSSRKTIPERSGSGGIPERVRYRPKFENIRYRTHLRVCGTVPNLKISDSAQPKISDSGHFG
jgi:hypothetical protein